ARARCTSPARARATGGSATCASRADGSTRTGAARRGPARPASSSRTTTGPGTATGCAVPGGSGTTAGRRAAGTTGGGASRTDIRTKLAALNVAGSPAASTRTAGSAEPGGRAAVGRAAVGRGTTRSTGPTCSAGARVAARTAGARVSGCAAGARVTAGASDRPDATHRAVTALAGPAGPGRATVGARLRRTGGRRETGSRRDGDIAARTADRLVGAADTRAT